MTTFCSLTRNLNAIFQGWKAYKFKSETIEKLAKERATICATCEHFKPNKIFDVMLPDRSIEQISGVGCNKCNCSLSLKLRQVLQSCPEKKWE